MKTRAKILRAILYDGPASRAELSKKLGISASGITDSAAQLCEEGILIESGYRPKTAEAGKIFSSTSIRPISLPSVSASMEGWYA